MESMETTQTSSPSQPNSSSFSWSNHVENHADVDALLRRYIQEGDTAGVAKVFDSAPSQGTERKAALMAQAMALSCQLGSKAMLCHLMTASKAPVGMMHEGRPLLYRCFSSASTTSLDTQLEMMGVLLAAGASVTQADTPSLRTPLHEVIRSGSHDKADEAIINLFLAHGASLNARDALGQTPLIYAVQRTSSSLVSFLVKRGARIDVADENKKTALHYLCQGPMVNKTVVEIANLLIQASASSLVCADKDGRNPLMYACRKRISSGLDYEDTSSANTVAAGQQTSVVDKNSSVVFEVLQLLLNAMPAESIYQQDSSGLTALDHSVVGLNREPEVVQLLLNVATPPLTILSRAVQTVKSTNNNTFLKVLEKHSPSGSVPRTQLEALSLSPTAVASPPVPLTFQQPDQEGRQQQTNGVMSSMPQEEEVTSMDIDDFLASVTGNKPTPVLPSEPMRDPRRRGPYSPFESSSPSMANPALSFVNAPPAPFPHPTSYVPHPGPPPIHYPPLLTPKVEMGLADPAALIASHPLISGAMPLKQEDEGGFVVKLNIDGNGADAGGLGWSLDYSAQQPLRPETRPVNPELRAGSTVVSMLQSCDGHKLVYRGLEQLAQKQNAQASHGGPPLFTTKEFRLAVGVLEDYAIVNIRPERGVGMACLSVQPHHRAAVSLVVINILLTDYLDSPCRWNDEAVVRARRASPPGVRSLVVAELEEIRQCLIEKGVFEATLAGNGDWLIGLKRVDMSLTEFLGFVGATPLKKPALTVAEKWKMQEQERKQQEQQQQDPDPRHRSHPEQSPRDDRSDDRDYRKRLREDGRSPSENEKRSRQQGGNIRDKDRDRERERDRDRERRGDDGRERENFREREKRGSADDKDRDRDRERGSDEKDRCRDRKKRGRSRDRSRSASRTRPSSRASTNNGGSSSSNNHRPPALASSSSSTTAAAAAMSSLSLDRERRGGIGRRLTVHPLSILGPEPDPKEALRVMLQAYEEARSRAEIAETEASLMRSDLDEVLKDRDYQKKRLGSMEYTIRNLNEEVERTRCANKQTIRELEKDLDRLRDADYARRYQAEKIVELEKDLYRLQDQERARKWRESERIIDLERELSRLQRGRSSHHHSSSSRGGDRSRTHDKGESNRHYRSGGSEGDSSSRELKELQRTMWAQTDTIRELEKEVARLKEKEGAWQPERVALLACKERRDKLEDEMAKMERLLDVLGAKTMDEALTAQKGAANQKAVEANQQEVITGLEEAKAKQRAALDEAWKRIKHLEGQVKSLHEDADDKAKEYNALSSLHFSVTAELNETKNILLALGDKNPGMVPMRWFCQANNVEVKKAIQKTLGDGQQVTTSMITRASKQMDECLRNPKFDPFMRKAGVIGEVDQSNAFLAKIVSKHGPAMGELLLEKRKEIEEWCPSGHYPVLTLWKDGQAMTVPQALRAVLSHMKLEF